MSDNLRTETIQVAAVAAAMAEDFFYGEANAERVAADGPDWDMSNQAERVGDMIYSERLTQDQKWGPQHHDPFTWLMILMEEVGEVAEEVEKGAIFTAHDHKEEYLVWAVGRMGRMAKTWLEAKTLA